MAYKNGKNQIIQYGLGGTLDPDYEWWENIAIEARQLMFVAMRSWLTISVLICEDLARQHPVAELVRSVGPNLVLSVLMDGPQLAARWPARYATVLADDPGCSVLTVSSLGMVQLSRPPNFRSLSRNVVLWKDAKSGMPVEIEVPAGASGVESASLFSAGRNGLQMDEATKIQRVNPILAVTFCPLGFCPLDRSDAIVRILQSYQTGLKTTV